MKKLLVSWLIGLILVLPYVGYAGESPSNGLPSTIVITATAAISNGVTLTLAAPGASLFHYISGIDMSCFAGAALTPAATSVLVTSTNLNGNPTFDFQNAGAQGTINRVQIFPTVLIKSSVAATATTIVAPVLTGCIWRLTAYYFIAP
jgi:hypothetical protein